MNTEHMTESKITVMVCTRQRDIPKPCCGDYGAEEVLSYLRSIAQNPSSIIPNVCTTQCHEGVTITIQPQNKVFTGIRLQHIPKELLDLLRNNNRKGTADTHF